VGSRILAYAACGLILGLVMGIGQLFLLKQRIVASKKWFWMTLAGYTLALPVGLAITTLIPAISFPLHGSGSCRSGTIYYFLLSFSNGYFYGRLGSWHNPMDRIKTNIALPELPLAIIWVVGVWLSFGLGIFRHAHRAFGADQRQFGNDI